MLQPGKLFRPFQQLRMGDEALRMPSSGLGLSIVKSIIVDQMNGEVGLASEEGEGALFFARIPIWARQSRNGVPPLPKLAPVLMIPESIGWGESGALDTSATAASRRSVDGDSKAAVSDRGTNQDSPASQSPSTLGGASVRKGKSSTKNADGISPTRRGRVAGETPTPRNREEREARREKRQRERGMASSTKARAYAAAAGGQPLSSAALAGVPSKGAALVVDDERVNRTLMARLLRAWGFTAAEMDDGKELVAFMEDMVSRVKRDADELSSAEWPLFVTLDVQMPEVDGFRVLERRIELVAQCRDENRLELANKLASIVVIGVTGNAVASDAERLLSLGAKKVLIKPVNPAELASCIESLCGTELPSKAHRRIGTARSTGY